jgi:hypothetical protein
MNHERHKQDIFYNIFVILATFAVKKIGKNNEKIKNAQ